ncbi:unnamed protein product [Linum trigynum]|uniref:Uncharacterized protein n=1 Tax=Linum trigynum TaxID=586398 RepID=A0AAV2CW35_9ROSI
MGVRYLRVPDMCKQCKEFGHCEGEVKECKVVQSIKGSELIRAEDMIDEVTWVSKTRASLAGKSNEGGSTLVAGSVSGGSAMAAQTTEGGPVLVVGSTDDSPAPVSGTNEGGLVKGSPVPVAGSSMAEGLAPGVGLGSAGTSTPLHSLSW